MKAVTGTVVDLDGDADAGAYLVNSVSGAGLMAELLSCRGVMKASVLQPDDTLERICIPTKDFMKKGDLVIAVKDDDNCDFNFMNLTRDTRWRYPRAPEHTRKQQKQAQRYGNIGMSLTVVLLLLQVILMFQFALVNLVFFVCVVTAFGAIFWALTTKKKAIKAHVAASENLINEALIEHSSFIARQKKKHVERLKQSTA